MLLFFTRDARFKFSTDGRFDGDGEVSRSPNGALFSALNLVGDPGSRLCQYCRGELELKGEESNGEEFSLKILFCFTSVIQSLRRSSVLLYLGGLIIAGRVPPPLHGSKFGKWPCRRAYMNFGG